MGQATEERMSTEIAGTRENLSRDVDALYDKVSPGRAVERRKAAVRGRVSSLRDSVMGSAQSAGGSAQGAAGSVQDKAQSAVGAVQSQTQGSPLAAGLVAFGAGMVISALIPASRAEAQAAQRLTETVKDSPVMDEAKSVGQEIGENLKQSATEAAQEVKGTAQEAAANVKDEGQAAAQSVKEEAPGT